MEGIGEKGREGPPQAPRGALPAAPRRPQFLGARRDPRPGAAAARRPLPAGHGNGPAPAGFPPPAGENRHLTAQPAHPPPSLRCSGTRTAPMLTDTDTHPAPPPRLLPAPAPAAYTLGWTRLCSDVLAYVRMYSAVFGWAGVVSAGLPSA